MPEAVDLHLPASRDVLASLRAGAAVLLSGPIFTARDATHARLVEELERDGRLPFGLEGQMLFYAGPTPSAGGRPIGSVGPTTAARMDAYTPALLAAGIVGTLGKGPRSEAVRLACVEHGAVYFAAVGGSAALLGRSVATASPVAYADLGTEALMLMGVIRLPAYVAIDTLGNDLYEQISAGREIEG